MVKLKGSKDKIKRRHKQSFARQFLKDHNITITQGEQQVLTPLDSRLYKIRLPRTKITTGMKFAERGEIKSITSYEELTSMGICIVSKTIGQKLRWESGQRLMYSLEKVKYSGEHIGKIPKDHYVEHDAYNSAVRLVGPRAGPLGTGPWKKTGDQRDAPEGAGRKADPLSVYKNPEKFIEKMMKEWTGEEEEAEQIYIEEAPFLITDNNEIVCLPKTGDMPSILISGMKGCLTADTKIITKKFPEGKEMIYYLNAGRFEVLSYDIKKKKFLFKKCEGVEFAKRADIYELRTEKGRILQGTEDHPVLTINQEYKKLAELKNADEIITIQGIEKVKEIIKTNKRRDVYDVVGVKDTANFVANGCVVSNTGKSFCLHSIISRLFWKPEFSYKICILNDSSRETGTWCFPNDDYDQINKLKMFNERPLPLPLVYFHPTVKEDYEKLYMKDVGFDITLPWKKIISNHDIYLNLKESKRYFSKVMPFLLNCKTEQDALQLMDNLVLQFNMPPQTANKIRAELETLLASKMTDLSFKNQAPWIVSKNPGKQYNPFTAALHAGLVPVLSTEYISNYRNILSIYFNYFVEDLFMRQKQDPDFLEEQSELLFVVDECFTPDTKVVTEVGCVPILDLFKLQCLGEIPPRVLSYNFDTKKQEYKEVEKVIRKKQQDLIEIRTDKTRIRATHNHKMHTHLGYVEAKNLSLAHALSSIKQTIGNTNAYELIRSVKKIKHPDSSPFVYDLTVSDNHNYYVTSKKKKEDAVLVSNCHNISQKGQRSTADMLLRRSVREGRPRRIGTLLATQKFMELPDVIKDNTTYLIVFKNPGEATTIAAQYNLGKHVANNIKDLNKHQCIAYTTEHFIVYSNDGRKRKSKLNEVFRGYSLPPFSLHKKPKNKEKNGEGTEPIAKKKRGKKI